MPHTYSNILIHFIFSTAMRRKLIHRTFEKKLYAYISGIARNEKIEISEIGGIEDHIHILLSLPRTTTISNTIKLYFSTNLSKLFIIFS